MGGCVGARLQVISGGLMAKTGRAVGGRVLPVAVLPTSLMVGLFSPWPGASASEAESAGALEEVEVQGEQVAEQFPAEIADQSFLHGHVDLAGGVAHRVLEEQPDEKHHHDARRRLPGGGPLDEGAQQPFA